MRILFHIIISLISFSISASADVQNIDLIKVAKALQFPYDKLKVEDYTIAEKSINIQVASDSLYKRHKTLNPDTILLAYKITSVEPYTFYPIIITVVKKGSYYNPEMVKLIDDTSRVPEVSYAKGGRLPFGDFSLTDQQKAFLLMGDVLLPDEPVQSYFDPPGSTRIVGGRPIVRPAYISYLQVANSDVEIKISVQFTFSEPKDLIKVTGGEVYHLNFFDIDSKVAISESNDPSVIILPKLFKALNEVALDAPALAQYLKKESAPSASANQEPKQPEKPTVSTPQEQAAAVVKPQPKETSWLWVIGSIALLAIIGFLVKRHFSKRTE